MILRLLLASLRRRLHQLALIMAAVALAAATVTALVGFSTRAGGSLDPQLGAFGPNLVVRPQVGGPERLPLAEVERIRHLAGVEAAAAVAAAGHLAPAGAEGLEILAVEPGILSVYPAWRLSGAWPRPGQMLLGSALPQATPELARSGSVAGVVETGGALDRAIFLPLEVLNDRAGSAAGADRVEVRAARDRLDEVAAEIEGQVAGAEARPLLKVSASEAALVSRLKRVLRLFALVSLVLALVSVAAATAALIEERRKEVGLFLALGYSARQVAVIFAVELLAAALLAGLAGEVAGELAAHRMATMVLGGASSTPGITWEGLVAASLAAVLVVASAMTSTLWRFARLDAAQVLRGE